MKFEVDHAVNEIVAQLRASVPLDARLRNLLVLVALTSLNPRDPQLAGELDIQKVSVLAARERLSDAGAPAESERVAGKLLDVLVHRRGQLREGQPTRVRSYRLPHNEYRDYLLADGLFRSICGDDPPAGGAPDVAADLARAYRRSPGVAQFLHEIVQDRVRQAAGAFRVADFSVRIIELMNDPDRLPSQEPQERSDCSPHGALLSLLLAIGPVPRRPALRTAGINFHGVVAPKTDGVPIRLPGTQWAGAVLREADLSGVDLSGCRFEGSCLDNVQLNGANLSKASLIRANMQNVSMGHFKGRPTVLSAARFDDGQDDASGADWFNYRFRGLQGYYCFWDIEPVMEGERILIVGSRGQLVLLDLANEESSPLYLQTGHDDDIVDVSRHPTQDVIVTTSRDGSVRLHRLPGGNPDTWPARASEEGVAVHPIEEIRALTGVFPPSHYPRRALFSRSGRWLVVTGRDVRVAFFSIAGDLAIEGAIGRCTYGLAHSGPVMCVDADVNPAENDPSPSDRFYTAGYDGRMVMWTESRDRPDSSWSNPLITRHPAVDARGGREIIRAVAADVRDELTASDGLWVGTETDWRLRYFVVDRDGLTEDPLLGTKFEHGVFSLALNGPARLLAVGLASGEVAVFRTEDGMTFDWTRPLCRCRTSDDIVRSLLFAADGTRLIAASWDGVLSVFDIADAKDGAELLPDRQFVYPESQWLPHRDVHNLVLDPNVDLARSRGLSTRMKRYLARVGNAHAERGRRAE